MSNPINQNTVGSKPKFYYTTMELNERDDLVTNPNILHGLVARAVGIRSEETPTEDKRYLWRINFVHGKRYLVIISRVKPFMDYLIKYCSYPDRERDEVTRTREYNSTIDKVTAGNSYKFMLAANPARADAPESANVRGTVRSIKSAEEQLAWLTRQGEKYGFTLVPDDSRVYASKVRRFKKKDAAIKAHLRDNPGVRIKIPTVEFRTATFAGRLTVTDAEKFRKAMVNGIGREKAYGQGLITVDVRSEQPAC